VAPGTTPAVVGVVLFKVSLPPPNRYGCAKRAEAALFALPQILTLTNIYLHILGHDLNQHPHERQLKPQTWHRMMNQHNQMPTMVGVWFYIQGMCIQWHKKSSESCCFCITFHFLTNDSSL
jgi:hypothetical protein